MWLCSLFVSECQNYVSVAQETAGHTNAAAWYGLKPDKPAIHLFTALGVEDSLLPERAEGDGPAFNRADWLSAPTFVIRRKL